MIEPKKFEELEMEHQAFSITVNDIPVWERVRFDVYRELRQEAGEGNAHTLFNKSIRTYTRQVYLALRNLFIKNPFLTPKCDYLFFGHPRRQRGPDKNWWDIYCDPIYEACDLDYVHFEQPYQLDHYRPIPTENIRYLELLNNAGLIQRKIGTDITDNSTDLSNNVSDQLQEIEDAILDEFGIEIDILSKVSTDLHIRKTELWLYRWLLDTAEPSVVVLVVSYVKETLIEACQAQEIPVVELQHGVIYPHHFGYSYRGERTKRMFPDYLFIFGDFWRDNASFPIPDDNIITVGYPYLEKSLERYSDICPKKQIVFVSQGTIGTQLSKFAKDVHQHPKIDHDIVYKLHPGEYNGWADRYPWLYNNDIRVIDSSDVELYRLFAESELQIGVSSTAVYEGLCFGLDTFIYKCDSSNILQPLIDQGVAMSVSSADELALKLGFNSSNFQRKKFFETDSVDKICSALNEVKETHSSE